MPQHTPPPAAPLVVAPDIDQTITCHPRFFAAMSTALPAAGHRVMIVTFRQDRPGAVADIRRWGVTCSDLVTATTDALVAHGPDQWKAHVCRSHGVDVLFDDSADVCRHVDERTRCVMPLAAHRDRMDAVTDVLRDG